ncbi:peptidase S8/S53 domain-containing protein [Truncatella angustata]|uniref:tripeptidyl-peptidase II n=1 Tax=Truncatella angustata TaxID=152316 RepID=A0A9P8RJI8_9PEZI|nr:peptidase S8/S53 domain-containing protein [Truncatella angustata]KAH6647208.1 peptidase S8/S53 domain-containing protein [Truncatella angustata]KAH8201490.1 hypothetical protein TruAng_004338 [Truncatella angustata]
MIMISPNAACYAALFSLAAPSVLGAYHQHFTTAPAGWSRAVVQPRSETKITFTLALAMQNIQMLEPLLFCTSDPHSSDYGNFKDAQELQSIFGPSTGAVNNVTAWLEAGGIFNYQVDGAFVDFVTDLTTANNVFNASYQHYTTENITKLRTLSYSIPDNIQEHVVLLEPSTYFGNTKAFQSKAQAATSVKHSEQAQHKTRTNISCENGMTPACLKEMYNIGNYSPDKTAGSRAGVGSFLGQSSLRADVAQFEDFFGVARQNVTKVIIADGPDDQDPATPFHEANLDVQNMIGIAAPLPITEFLTGGSPPFIPGIDSEENTNEPFVPFFRYLLSRPNSELPQVISLSYGEAEDTVPYDYAVLTCSLIALQGLRGITIISASGDTGVGASCVAPDNKTAEFNPAFPATCPYITSVGGTVGSSSPEAAWSGSSGGFSKYFPRPLYQQGAITRYLNQVDSATIKYYSQYTNFNGRGFPDVAAHSAMSGYMGFYNGQRDYNGGTSGATPIWAGVVALLNDARLRAGKSTLGWLNPLLYTVGHEALNDITAGKSVGCNGVNGRSSEPEPAGAGIIPRAFWNATPGWDPVTGFGTPNFDNLKTLVLSL